MKRANWIFLLLFGSFAFSAQAAQPPASKPYFGIEAGLMMPDASNFDDAVNIGGIIGVPIAALQPDASGDITGSIALEGELTVTLIEGDIDFTSADWDVWTLGGYGVYRSPSSNNLYFKGKVGVVHSDVDVSSGSFSASDSDTDPAIGVGLGIKMGASSKLEFEFTLLDDLDFLSVAYLF
jgi:opacity protein-like surface antigen